MVKNQKKDPERVSANTCAPSKNKNRQSVKLPLGRTIVAELSAASAAPLRQRASATAYFDKNNDYSKYKMIKSFYVARIVDKQDKHFTNAKKEGVRKQESKCKLQNGDRKKAQVQRHAIATHFRRQRATEARNAEHWMVCERRRCYLRRTMGYPLRRVQVYGERVGRLWGSKRAPHWTNGRTISLCSWHKYNCYARTLSLRLHSIRPDVQQTLTDCPRHTCHCRVHSSHCQAAIKDV